MPRVALVLAGGPGFPTGSEAYRYEFEATLDPRGQLDPELWHADPEIWRAWRHRPDLPVRAGDVQHDSETGWSLHFPPSDAALELNEVLLPAGPLRPGDYVTVRAEEGRDYSYRVVSVG